MLTLTASAKINLTLEVLGKRPDGYHEIRTILQTVSLCDYLALETAPDLTFACNLPGWQAERSLVSRAANLLKQTTNCQAGAAIRLNKHIPLQSGLGGDASDGAAALCGLNHLWGLNQTPGELCHLAAQLGSDVPFFLTGGTAIARGRGEEVNPLPGIGQQWLVVLVPPVSIPAAKTATLYGLLQPPGFTQGEYTDAMVEIISQRLPIHPDLLYNVFDSVASQAFPRLSGFRQVFVAAGAASVYLAGAGPALFSLHQHKPQAEKVYDNLKHRGLEAYLVETLGCHEITWG
jgi:4-diphosphocytidyl-2-C-methyl-D-erythritol kinase